MFSMGGEKNTLKNLVLQVQYNVFNSLSAYLHQDKRLYGQPKANLKPTRELTATWTILLSVNIPEKFGQTSFCSCPSMLQSVICLVKIFHCIPITVW